MTLEEFFAKNKKLAIALSGGIDSAYLLYSAVKYGTDVLPVFVKSEFQPEFEKDDALKFAKSLNLNVRIAEISLLSNENVIKNDNLRCYWCKKKIISTIKEIVNRENFSVIADGTNASDAADDRPGMIALREFGVLSPLRECGITKTEIRQKAKEAGVFLWNKPAYACLATRIPTGVRIENEILIKTEKAESELIALGFYDFRVRYFYGAARVQIKDNQKQKFISQADKINELLKKYFDIIMLDLEKR